MARQSSRSAREIELPDGSRVVIAPMEPGDADGLQRFHRTLSDHTTYLRFFAVHPVLSTREVERFTLVDHVDREAVTAKVGDEIVAVARFDRTAGGGEAEVAFVVGDAWQGRGLGSVLFREIVDRARLVGVRTLVADTLATNSRMLAVFHHAGLPVSSTIDNGVLHLRIALGQEPPVSDAADPAPAR
jgi:GNAT superfamily N-acetyltransferase